MENPKTISSPGKFSRLLKWFRKKSFLGKILWTFIFLFILFLLAGERSEISRVLLIIRKYFTVITLLVLIVWGLVRIFKRSETKGRVTTLLFVVGLVIGFILLRITPWGVYNYVSSYVRYQSLNKISISSLPETGHELIQPRISVQTSAGQQIQQTETTSPPYLVRNDSSYRWTLSLQPNTFVQRLVGKVETVYSVPAESSVLNFSGNHQNTTSFLIGENLYLGAEASTATIRRLSLFDLFTVEPGEPRFMKDDNGEWVQVVPLIRWVGTLFPQPEFGGVNVIHEQHEGHYFGSHIVEMARRFLFGTGDIYSPTEMKKFKYLQNQNLMPEEVTLSIAKSFRFQNGFSAPMQWNHQGDTRIPVVDSGGIDEQPTTTFFKMSSVKTGAKDMLYEYIGLQPFDEKKDGLVISLFIPSDGEMTVYTYKYDSRKDGVLGSTAAPVTIRTTQQSNFWIENKVTGIRCYNIKINGEIRTFWKASIVTKSKHANGYISSSNAKIALVDLKTQQVIWVDGSQPSTWPELVKKQITKTDIE